MRQSLAVATLLLLVVAAPVGGVAGGVSIVGVAPNPVTAGDAGEYVTVRVPPGTDLGRLRIADGESTARGPNRTASGRVHLSTAPAAAIAPDGPVYPLRGDLSLSNGGERVELRRSGTTLAAVTYPDAPAAEVWNGSWRPIGAADRDAVAARHVRTRAFALPDAAGIPLSVVRSADRRLLLAGYTFRSRRVTRALVEAHRRGVDVRVLVEGGPVGGIDATERALLHRLVTAGVNVTRLDGPRARYRYHHAKYAVADDRVLVTSENWGPSGTGGGNRGWGAVVESERLADRLADTFHGDAGWRDGKPWRGGANATLSPPDGERFPSRFDPVVARADQVRLLLAPDNAGRGIRRLLRSADESLLVQQVRIEAGHPFLNATVAAARRGVRVRVLLSGRWYVREENRRVARRLNRIAAREGLDLAAKLAEPRSRYRAIHVKGVVVDGRQTLVGSVNWNSVAVTENREAALVIADGAVAARFQRVFRADWRGGAWRIHLGVVAVALAAAVGTGRLLWRRIEFSGGRPPAGPARSPRRPSSRRARREQAPASRRRT